MDASDDSLPRPGVLGIMVRLVLAAAVGWMGYALIADAPGYWDGFDDPVSSLGFMVPLALFTSWVVNELFRVEWGWRPTFVMLVGAAVATALGSFQGDAFGPVYGVFVWTWGVAFATLLAPAFLLAALLRTPGCEMRSYAHLWTIVRGGDPASVACRGWIDRLDQVRVFGRW